MPEDVNIQPNLNLNVSPIWVFSSRWKSPLAAWKVWSVLINIDNGAALSAGRLYLTTFYSLLLIIKVTDKRPHKISQVTTQSFMAVNILQLLCPWFLVVTSVFRLGYVISNFFNNKTNCQKNVRSTDLNFNTECKSDEKCNSLIY